MGDSKYKSQCTDCSWAISLMEYRGTQISRAEKGGFGWISIPPGAMVGFQGPAKVVVNLVLVGVPRGGDFRARF